MQMRSTDKLSTHQKALTINLDDGKYGTLVEIGAGQEVARQFFAAGAAAGTVAKTMSAYDMQISDEIYGKAGRYVSRERLEQMLKKEFDLVVERLTASRDSATTFFSYAATVSALNYAKDNECHGWIGLRLQLRPGEEPSSVIMHVRMLDMDNAKQAEALGRLGVNLIYGAYYQTTNPKQIIESLLDNIGQDRIEVDLIHFEGPAFSHVENRLMNLHLIRSWLTRAVMFDSDGRSVPPRDMLYKRPVMVMRGSYAPPTKVHADMAYAGLQQFYELDGVNDDTVVPLAELTMAELVAGGKVDDSDFLSRVDLLAGLGYTVLISDYVRFFSLRSWLRRYTHNDIGIVLSVLDFSYLFDEKYYEGLEGGILEAMGKLFPDNTHVYVYPARVDGALRTLNDAPVEEKQRLLLEYLIANGLLVPCKSYNEENLHISAREIIKQIPKGDGEWEQQLHERVVSDIKTRKLFGYPNTLDE